MVFGRGKKKEKPPKLYPSKDAILLTTETDIQFKPCKVMDDHKLKWGKKEIEIMPERPAHIFSLNPRMLFQKTLHKILAFLFLPNVLTFRTYTAKREGEITHDPDFDNLKDTEKMKLEAILKLKGTAAKADIVNRIMAGLKEKLGFWNYFRDVLYIAVIIILILTSQGVI